MIRRYPFEIESLEDLKKAVKKYQRKERWIFRGHTDWPSNQNRKPTLRSSLERFLKRERVPNHDDKPNQVEAELIREFKRAYHQYAVHLPQPDATIEWLSLMQHHGAPTRMIDFTYSIYVAAYFALEEQRDDGYIVWAINSEWAQSKSLKALYKQYPTLIDSLDILMRPATDSQELICAQQIFFTRPYVKCAFTQNAFRLNERLRVQRGVFLVPGDINCSFIENLEALEDYKENTVRFHFVKSKRQGLLRDLHQMNITRTSLFPGIDGYAKSLGVHLPRLQELLDENN